MSATPTPNDQPAKPKAKRVLNLELQTMAELDRLMCELPDDDARQWVLLWLCSTHGTAGFRVAIGEQSKAPSEN